MRYNEADVRPILSILFLLSACSFEAAPRAYEGGEPVGAKRGSMFHVLINAYYLQEESARALRRGEAQSAILEEVLGKAKRMGATLIRSNAYNDAPHKAGDSVIQYAAGQYDEVGLRALDLVLTRAHAHGLRLLLPLGNFWDAYGGARQYCLWAGLSDAREGDSRFFTERRVVELYKTYIRHLLTRTNHFDGIPYAEHPAIFGWELLNEARGRGLDDEGRQMRAWVDEIGALIRSLSPRSRISTGEEGFDHRDAHYDADFWQSSAAAGWMFHQGTSFRRNLESPFVDFGSVHIYPDGWGIPAGASLVAGFRWIEERSAIAAELGKPLLIGEFGLRAREGAIESLEERRAIYREWFAAARRAGAIAAGPWLFAHDSRPDGWDPYSFYLYEGTELSDPRNRYADIVAEAARSE